MKKSYVPHPGRRELLTAALLLVEILFFGIFAKNFFTSTNITTVIQNAAEIGLICIGMSMCIIMGGTDLSVGSALGICALLSGMMIERNVNPILIVLVSILIGAVIGMINGSIIATFDVPPLIATLAMSNVLRAMIFGLLNGRWLTGLSAVFAPLVSGRILGIPKLLLILLFAYLLFYFVMMNTTFGRHIYAVGSNKNAAKMVGIDPRRSLLGAFTINGAIVGLSAILYVARMGAVDMTVGQTLPIQCIAAVFLGGTSVKGRGDKGSLLGTFAGVFFIAFMKNGIVLMGIPSLLENAIIGLLIILSVLFDSIINDPARIERNQLRRAQKEAAK